MKILENSFLVTERFSKILDAIHFGCICIQNKLHPKIVKRDLAQILDAGILDAVKEFFISNGQWSVTSGFLQKNRPAV